MAESIKEIAEAKSFTSLQEKVEKLQEEFTVSFILFYAHLSPQFLCLKIYTIPQSTFKLICKI